jgi:hypothetical protein
MLFHAFFAKLHNEKVESVHLHVSSPKSLNRFKSSFMLWVYIKICRKNIILVCIVKCESYFMPR